MIFFSNLKQRATDFLEPYKTKEPATFAAAEQAIGAILITDGFVGIHNPFGSKNRRGIFGTIGGMILGIIFILIPTFFGNVSNINNMTAVASATVVSVGQFNDARNNSVNGDITCPLVVSYSVDGREYTSQSPMSSSDQCSLSVGQIISINYNPENPNSWVYGSKTVSSFLHVFFWVGLLILVSSGITFLIRLLSIIFGWKLLKEGRKNAAKLPAGTNLQTMIDEIKQNFTASIFGFGGAQDIKSKNTPDSPSL